MTTRDVWFQTSDGVRLYAQDWGPIEGTQTPLLCLAGLTRNHRDFEPVAEQFSGTRRVIALDFRGRGKSGWTDPKTYRPDVEMADSIALLDHLGIARAAVLGSSRGGLVGMLMGVKHPARMAGLILNDVGPVIEVASLKRIAAYVGRGQSFETWDAAALAVAKAALGFDGVSQDEWVRVAKRIYGVSGIHPCTEHDPGLAVNFPTVEQLDAKPVPDSWALFDGLGDMPVGVLRGSGSDLLAAATVVEMKKRRAGLMATVITGRGHIPFLDEAESVAALGVWLDAVDEFSTGSK